MNARMEWKTGDLVVPANEIYRKIKSVYCITQDLNEHCFAAVPWVGLQDCGKWNERVVPIDGTAFETVLDKQDFVHAVCINSDFLSICMGKNVIGSIDRMDRLVEGCKEREVAECQPQTLWEKCLLFARKILAKIQ